jgi:threonine/homoserine/homoserine lactone efflux protein
VLGLFLIFVAYRDWKKRPKPGEIPEMPKWMSSIDSFTAGKALGMGVLLSGVNPKNLALILSAGVAIAAAGLTASETIIVLIIFIVIACISVATPVIAYLVLGEKAESTLNSWKAWLIQNNAAVMTVVFLLFGVKLLADGLGALIGG